MRSASYSFSRVKLSWFCDLQRLRAGDRRLHVAWPLFEPPARDARIASASPASDSSSEFFWFATMRAMWRCVTCEISCASTLASSDSFCASRIEPRVDADVAARQRECVDLRVGHREELEVLLRVARRGDQAVAELVQVVVDFRVVQVAALRADLPDDGLADLALLRRRQPDLRRVAEVGQRRCGAGRPAAMVERRVRTAGAAAASTSGTGLRPAPAARARGRSTRASTSAARRCTPRMGGVGGEGRRSRDAIGSASWMLRCPPPDEFNGEHPTWHASERKTAIGGRPQTARVGPAAAAALASAAANAFYPLRRRAGRRTWSTSPTRM